MPKLPDTLQQMLPYIQGQYHAAVEQLWRETHKGKDPNPKSKRYQIFFDSVFAKIDFNILGNLTIEQQKALAELDTKLMAAYARSFERQRSIQGDEDAVSTQ